jgi:hypothetical protein
MPFFALAFVSYASPTAMIAVPGLEPVLVPSLSLSAQTLREWTANTTVGFDFRNLPFASLYSARTCPPCCYSLSVTTPPAE